jgi:hypothetical protein
MVDVMLDSINKKECPKLIEDLALKSFLQLPMAVLHRKHRERLMTSWQNNLSSVLQPAVLALKIRVMRYPMFYEVRY